MKIVLKFLDDSTLQFNVGSQREAFELARQSFPGQVREVHLPDRSFTAAGQLVRESQ